MDSYRSRARFSHGDMPNQAPSDAKQPPITRLLRDWQGGKESALDALIPAVHHQLLVLARKQMAGERGLTMQPTALVNEAYLRLVDSEASFSDRSHFYAMAARVMRHILVDQARARASQKRGGDQIMVRLDDAEPIRQEDDQDPVDFLALDQALTALSRRDEQKGEILVLTYFGGMTTREIGAVLGISAMKVSRDLRFARAWLAHNLGDPAATA